MLKVLFISAWYPTRFNKTHGIFVKRQASAVAGQNKVAVIHVYGDQNFSEDLRIESSENEGFFEVFVFYKKKKNNPLKKFTNYKNYYFKGLEYLQKHWGSPDILHANVLFPTGIAAIEISKKLNIPFVVSEHWTGYHPEDGNYSGFVKKHFTKKAASQASAIITVTENLKQAMLNHGLHSKYYIVPNVVDTSVFNVQENTVQAKKRFLHVSSLDERQKNTGGIISVFSKSERLNKETELIIIGDGEDRNRLEKQAGHLLGKSIFFVGQKFGPILASEFNRAASLVLFSNYENLPVVILEALCCGTPVISTAVGGIKEFVEEDAAIFVNPGDQTALENAMLAMLNRNDATARKEISAKYSKRFSNETIGKELNDIYLAVTKNNM